MIKLKEYLNRPTYAVDRPWTEGTFSFGSEYTHNRYKFNTAGTFIKYYKISQLIHTQIIAN